MAEYASTTLRRESVENRGLVSLYLSLLGRGIHLTANEYKIC